MFRYKRCFAFLALSVVCLLLAGCQPGNAPPAETSGTSAPAAPDLSFHAEYFRTNILLNYIEEDIEKIVSKEELNQYCGEMYDSYNGYLSEGSKEFLQLVNRRYDESFFEDHILAIIYVQAGSGSIRFEVSEVTQEEDKGTIHLDCLIPEVFTDDMAGWIIPVELDRQTFLEGTIHLQTESKRL